MKRYFDLRILLVFVGLAAGLLIAEGGAQILKSARQKDSFLIPHPILHHAWKPNLKTVDRTRSIAYPLIINSQGWVEEYDVAREKPRGTYRIFYVGDSNTQGVVAAQFKAVEIIKQRLNGVFGARGPRMEVINTGTSSYSPLIYYLLIKKYLLDYQPDLIVINVNSNDVVDDSVYIKSAVFDERGELAAIAPWDNASRYRYLLTPEGYIQLSWDSRLYQQCVEFSALCYYIDKTLVARRVSQALSQKTPNVVDQADWLAREWSPEIKSHVAASMRTLADIIKLARKRHVRLLVTEVPALGQFTGEYSDQTHIALKHAVESAGGIFLDTYAEMKRRYPGNKSSELFWKEDPFHLSIQGNAVWAQIQLDFLLDPSHRLLPK